MSMGVPIIFYFRKIQPQIERYDQGDIYKQFKPPEKMVRNVSNPSFFSNLFSPNFASPPCRLRLLLLSSGHFIRDYQVVENNSNKCNVIGALWSGEF